jgi:hypothetical protein
MKLIMGGLIFVGLLVTMVSYTLVGHTSASSAADVKAQGQKKQKKVHGTASPQLKQYDDVGSLTADSQYIIVGVPVYQASHTGSPSSHFVWTDYRVKVLSVLKGDVSPGSLISVRTEGGSVILPDGTEIETQMPAFWKSPVKGEGCILFLSKKRPESPYFRLTGGPQGLFLISPWDDTVTNELDLSAEQVVVPQVRPSDKLMKSYQGMSVKSFLARLR